MKKNKTQKTEVLKYMQTHKGITSIQAFERFGITRLADVIYRLKKDGWHFDKEMITKKNRYGHAVTFAKYSLTD